MEIETNLDGVISAVRFVNTKEPEGFEIDAGQISTEAPDINSLYVAPTGPSTDRFDDIITIDGYNIQLPVPVTELTAQGWTLDTATDDYISGNSFTWTSMEKNGEKIDVTLRNYTSDSILPVNAYITEITVDVTYCSLEVIFPGGLKAGDTGDAFAAVYSDLGEDYYTADEEGDYYSVYNYDEEDVSKRIYVYMNYDDTGIIDSYSYEAEPDDIK